MGLHLSNGLTFHSPEGTDFPTIQADIRSHPEQCSLEDSLNHYTLRIRMGHRHFQSITLVLFNQNFNPCLSQRLYRLIKSRYPRTALETLLAPLH